MNYKLQPNQYTEPGVFVNVLNHGVLLSGASGIGKSELALVLIRNGHQLIADDAVIFSKETQAEGNAILMGSCPPVTQNFLEIRGLGIVDVYELFGEKVIAPKKKLDLIIKLIRAIDDEHSQIDRIHGMYQEKKLHGCAITEVTLPVAPGRNLSILVEVAIRNYILRNNGYHAAEILKERQRQAMESME